MAQNVVNLPTVFFKLAFSIVSLFLTRNLLRPPRGSWCPSIFVGRVRSTHSKETTSVDIVNLASHEMNDVLANALHAAVVPFLISIDSDQCLFLPLCKIQNGFIASKRNPTNGLKKRTAT